MDTAPYLLRYYAGHRVSGDFVLDELLRKSSEPILDPRDKTPKPRAAIAAGGKAIAISPETPPASPNPEHAYV